MLSDTPSQSDMNGSPDLEQFGLTQHEADLYLLLLRRGKMSVVEASHVLGIPRTTLYRLADDLVDKQMLRWASDSGRGNKLEAASGHALERLLQRRQQSLDAQKQALPAVLGTLTNLSGEGVLGSRIIHYPGQEGLRQVTVNSLAARDELRIIEIGTMADFLGLPASMWVGIGI